MAVKAILSIILFIITYLLLIILAVGLTVAFGYAGLMLIIFKPMFLTLMLGIGMMSVGILIMLFLFKFITKKYTVDRSHLHQITAEDEPKLFELIDQVVNEVKTPFPKRVYLSHEINAAVFYNSSFWSMIFPVRKNLQIGVGLINSVTTTELKAIIAHEFGHFSQRSMKVGSYVYNVNRVIYNLLYENESYGNILQQWASASNYFHLFTQIAIKIIQGIQWVLRKVYVVVNINYMALSREMEFHADEVAANVVGARPVISSLLRLGLADQTFTMVLDYYGRQIENNLKTNNVYAQHGWLMNFIGTENNIPLEYGLPSVSKAELSRFNKSKLTFKDQWSSHPSTDERTEHLLQLDLPNKEVNNELASSLFVDKNRIQEFVTEKLFGAVQYASTPAIKTTEQFIVDYKTTFIDGSFPKVYNGYYDNKGLELNFSPGDNDGSEDVITDLFGDAAIDLIYTADAMENDIASLTQVATGKTDVKSFDYNGQRYTVREAADLATRLSTELKNLRIRITDHDKRIYEYFDCLAKQRGEEETLMKKRATYREVDQQLEVRLDLYNKMISDTDFLKHTTPYDTIESNLLALQSVETAFKEEIRKVMGDEAPPGEPDG